MSLSRSRGLSPMSAKRRAEYEEAGIFPVSTFRAPRSRFENLDRKDLMRPKFRPPRRDNEFSAEVVAAILERDLHSCARCGRGVGSGRGMFWSIQHRRARQGIWLPDTNLAAAGLVLCGSGATGCHSEVEERHEEDRVAGYWIRQFADGKPTDPTTVRVKHAAHGWVLLDNFGGYVSTDPPEEAAA